MAGFDLPPLMLTHHESEALMVAIRLLKTWGGDSLTGVGIRAGKVLAILPPESRRRAEQTRIFAPDFGNQPHSRSAFDLIHRAVSAQQVLALHYRDESGNLSRRDVQPLGLFFWGEHWLLVGWCEKRDDYRCFRVDRCLKITPLDRHFRESADRSLSDFCVKYAVKTSHKKPAVKLACLRNIVWIRSCNLRR